MKTLYKHLPTLSKKEKLLKRKTRLCFVQSLYASFYGTLPITKAFLDKEVTIDNTYLELLNIMYKKNEQLIRKILNESTNIKPFCEFDRLFQSILLACCADFCLGVTDKILLLSEYLIIANGFFSSKECKLMNGILNYALTQLNERI